MNIPVSTYRLQLSAAFRFQDLRNMLDYLSRLGISTVYSSPFFQARPGSTHGYDITDPFHLNNEIGTLEEFRKIRKLLKEKNMTWLQDIVPNHMAYDPKNPWLRDLFELGPASVYYTSFDIDWEEGKVKAPFLGESLENVLKHEQLEVQFEGAGFQLVYFDHVYPVSARSYAYIFSKLELEEWQQRSPGTEVGREQFDEFKTSLLAEGERDIFFKESIKKGLERINRSPGILKEILALQYFLPVHWKTTDETINYRRFFTINDLICLKMEDEKVFQEYHVLIKDLVQDQSLDGLRIDHIDGLFDPRGYLMALRGLIGEEIYLVIEKILEGEENLPKEWPIQGTSGYEFLAAVNQLMTDPGKETSFTHSYNKFYNYKGGYEDLLFEKKLFILEDRMGGEYNNLLTLARDSGLLPEDTGEEHYKKALGAFLAAFPVYRIYPEAFPLVREQQQVVKAAYQKALSQKPELKEELLLVKHLFLGEAQKDQQQMLYFLQRCQQFSGPLAAKGGEDTAFYIYNRLISHNEVGETPGHFGLIIPAFHQKMQERRATFPLSLNATATHDTKRGEDARMRINVLSELDNEWFECVEDWMEVARRVKTGDAPNNNECYFIFQMLVGAFPFDLEPDEEFLDRSEAYLQKALREAKVNSSWAVPNEAYEKAVSDFLRALLHEEGFLSSFLPFQKKVMAFGALKSLSQTLLKLTAPGIPDIYQGTELWDLSYVDPDNRRPVDYSYRTRLLSEMTGQVLSTADLEILKQEYASGRIKLFSTLAGLKIRHEYREVFEEGDYLPLELREAFRDRVISFARKHGDHWVLIVAPVLVCNMFDEHMDLLREVQEQEVLELPGKFPGNWKNAYSGQTLSARSIWTAKELFSDFPIVLLTNERGYDD